MSNLSEPVIVSLLLMNKEDKFYNVVKQNS